MADPLNLERAFFDKGWLLFAGAADVTTVDGAREAFRVDLAEEFQKERPDPWQLLKWLLRTGRFLTPYASLRYRTEALLGTHVFTRISDCFSRDFSAVVKYCPGIYAKDLRPSLAHSPSAMYTIVMRREDDDRSRAEAWDMLHALGHVWAINGRISTMSVGELEQYMARYQIWLANPATTFPSLGEDNARQIELAADVFATAAMDKFGRPVVESDDIDQERFDRAADHLRVSRHHRHHVQGIFEPRSWSSGLMRSDSWLKQEYREATGDVPRRLLAGDLGDTDMSRFVKTAYEQTSQMLQGIEYEAYAPFRTLIEFLPRLVQDDSYFNLSVRVCPSPDWNDTVGVSAYKFDQLAESSRGRDYTQYVLTVKIPPRPCGRWSEYEQIDVLRTLCRLFYGIVNRSISRDVLDSCGGEIRWVDTRAEDRDVRALAATAYSVFRSPGDLLTTRVWEWSRAVLGCTPFASELQTTWGNIDTEMHDLRPEHRVSVEEVRQSLFRTVSR